MGPPEQILYPDGYVCHGVFCGRIGSGDGCSYSIPSDCPEDIALQIFALHWQCGRINQSWPHPTDIYKRGKRLHTCGHHEEHQDLPDGGRDELQDLHEGGEDQDVPQNLHEGGQGQDEHHVMPQPTDDQPELPQLTGGQKLLDVGLPQAIDGQLELRQLTDGVREESVQTIQLEDDKIDVLVSQDDGSFLNDSHSHSWSEDDQSWLAHKTWAEDCSSWPTEDDASAWHDILGPAWHNKPSPDWHIQLPDAGLPQASDGQPELRQLTGIVREERVETVPAVEGGSPEPPDDGGVPHRPPDDGGVPHDSPDDRGVPHEPADDGGVPHRPPDDGGVPHRPPDDGGVPNEPPDGGGVSLQQPGVSPEPPNARGVTGYRPNLPDDGFQQPPDGCPRPLPPECQPELPQLTDHVREERDRAQFHCSAQQVPLDAYNRNDQVSLLYNGKSSLDILILASFRTFDGGGDNDTLHVYCAAGCAHKLRTQLLIQHSTQFLLVT